MQSVKRSERTIEGYRNDIEIFFCWNLKKNNNKLFTDLKKRDVIAFQNWLINDNHNSPTRIRRIKGALSSFSNYIANVCDDQFPNFVPVINKIESPSIVPVYEKTVLTMDEVQRVLKTLVDEQRYQIACIFALAISCGARKTELLRFKVSFFTEENIIYGSLYKTPPIKTKGRSGGKYINKYVLVESFKPYFDLWMMERDRLGIQSDDLFVMQKDNGRVQVTSEEALNYWAKTITKILGKPFYWHSARHYWTSYLLRAGIPEGVVTDLSGWQSIDMVSTYDDRDKDETFAQYFRDGKIIAHETKELNEL